MLTLLLVFRKWQKWNLKISLRKKKYCPIAHVKQKSQLTFLSRIALRENSHPARHLWTMVVPTPSLSDNLGRLFEERLGRPRFRRTIHKTLEHEHLD